jgi:hypothetical protein
MDRLEKDLLADLSIEAGWALIEEFSNLVRESGSQDERTAADYITQQLSSFGVPHIVYQPELYLSVPRSASLEVPSAGRELRAKASSFSASTGETGLSGELLLVSEEEVFGIDELFDAGLRSRPDVGGKIVLLHGFAGPDSAFDLERRGAIAQVYINPGQNIHWGTCTSVWGNPDLDSLPRKPSTPIIDINQPDGLWLVEQAAEGGLGVTVRTDLFEGWTECPLIVAEVPGATAPEEYILVHGHYDSWDVGIGDNAVGNATLLELARLFWAHQGKLRRSIRFAWWPGHSTGRYAGSTWYADEFALDLYENCVAHINIDSPGCRWATEYYDLTWMAEAGEFCQETIKDATGKNSDGLRPDQSGDYSFYNIGLTGLFCLLSTMPRELIAEKGFYGVWGCGANIGWHTEDDTLEIADRENLLRDLRVYVLALRRLAGEGLLPLDFVRTADEFLQILGEYQESGGDGFDLSAAVEEAEALREDLVRFYERARQAADPQPHNRAIMRLGRALVPVNYNRAGPFRYDPAVWVPPLPDLAPMMRLGELDPGSDLAGFVRTHLKRGRNRVVAALREARRAVAGFEG